MHFIIIFQKVRPIIKTRNQLAVKAIGQDAADAIQRLLLERCLLKLAVRLGKSRRTGGLVVYLYAADNSYGASGPRLHAIVSSPTTDARPPAKRRPLPFHATV